MGGGWGIAQQCVRDILGGVISKFKDNLLYWLNESVQIYIYIGISEGGGFWVKGDIYIFVWGWWAVWLHNNVVGIY